MPGDYTYKPKTREQYTRLWGVVTDADILRLAREAAEDPTLGPNTREIVDLREVDRADVTQEGIRAAAEADRAHPEKFSGSRTAIVAEKDAHYGLARMYANLMTAMGAPTQVRVFRTIEEARAWLDTTPRQPDPPSAPSQ
jgi:hypothetical protein